MNNTKHYNWQEVQAYYDAGHTMRETKKHFGFATASWDKAVKRGDIVARKPNTIYQILSGEVKIKNRYSVRKRIIENDILPYHCDRCGISDWNNEPLALHLDHKNGINDDDRIENLRFLCPNCHSQTDNYAGKAKGNGQYNRAKIRNKTRGSKF